MLMSHHVKGDGRKGGGLSVNVSNKEMVAEAAAYQYRRRRLISIGGGGLTVEEAEAYQYRRRRLIMQYMSRIFSNPKELITVKYPSIPLKI